MTPDLRDIRPSARLRRIARAPDPWAWPEWARRTRRDVGNRWDDPASIYRVLYASSTRLGAFVEVLARFRPDPHVLEQLASIDAEEDDSAAPGDLDASWLARRCIGEASIAGLFVDVGHSESLARIRHDLAGRVVHYGLEDLDAAAIRLRSPRSFTQEISRYVYDRTTADGARAYAGISYLSRLGDEFRNWAIFEPATEDASLLLAGDASVQRIDPGDLDLRRAVAIHGIRIVGG